MSEYDALLERLAARVDALSHPSSAGLFWCIGTTLAAGTAMVVDESTLGQAFAAGRHFALSGMAHPQAAALLLAVEGGTPSGEASAEATSPGTQQIWICADVCLRIQADPEYRPGPAIEFALEPVVSTVSQEMFGVSQPGSEDEAQQYALILRDQRVTDAVSGIDHALEHLERTSIPVMADLQRVLGLIEGVRPSSSD